MKTQLTEKIVRATAHKAGLKLENARGKVANGYGQEIGYWVTDPDINLVVFGGDTNGCGRSLEQCAAYLELSPAERWHRVQEATQLI